MTAKALKNTYLYSLLLLSVVIITVLRLKFGWDFSWWEHLFVIGGVVVVSKFLYVYFSGLNVHEVKFVRVKESKQFFIMTYQVGFSSHYPLMGYFDDDVSIVEEDLAQMIYNQMSRGRLIKCIKNGEAAKLKNVNTGQFFEVNFLGEHALENDPNFKV